MSFPMQALRAVIAFVICVILGVWRTMLSEKKEYHIGAAEFLTNLFIIVGIFSIFDWVVARLCGT